MGPAGDFLDSWESKGTPSMLPPHFFGGMIHLQGQALFRHGGGDIEGYTFR